MSALVMSAEDAKQLITQIKLGIDGVRLLILQLDEQRGWEALGYGSLRQCLLAEFPFAKSNLYSLLSAAKVEQALDVPVGSIPERHLRPLAPFKDEPETVKTVWAEAQVISIEEDVPVTGDVVARAVARVMDDEPAKPPLKRDLNEKTVLLTLGNAALKFARQSYEVTKLPYWMEFRLALDQYEEWVNGQ